MIWSFLVLLFIHDTICVDRSNFRTCKDSSFCTRQNAYWPEDPEYVIDNNKTKISSDAVQAVLISDVTGKQLNLSITYHAHSVFRVLIDEANPIRPRYRLRPDDALMGEPKKLAIRVSKTKDKLIVVGSDYDRMEVHYTPFRATFIRREEVLMSINERALLLFEHQLLKPDPVVQLEETNEASKVELSVSGEDKVNAVDTNNEENSNPTAETSDNLVNVDETTTTDAPLPPPLDWSESFKGHRDSRPYGPTSVGVDVTFHGFENVYGIPEHGDTFALKDTDTTDPYRLYNLDVFEYELYNPMALYGSVPVMWAHRKNATAGIFWHNPAETWISVKSSKSSDSEGLLAKLPRLFSRSDLQAAVRTRWMSEAGVIDVFIMLADDPRSAMKSYASLTGTTKIPPLFALAYHQSRWNYKNQDDVKAVSNEFDNHNIPLDVMWLDIEYSDGKRYLEWDKNNFPNGASMLEDLSSKNRKLVVVVDPHIKRDANWKVYSESQEVLVKSAEGHIFDGWCWPGSSSWPDFLRRDVEDWWANLFLNDQFLPAGSMFYAWNDMNEPSVFSGVEITIPKDVRHADQWENRDVHNIYGLLVHKATWNGLLKRSGHTERPFVLTRAFFAGSQRTSAVWTGDNKASWDHLKISVPMLLSLSVTGITFCGADVGGFFGAPSGDLLVRWYQAAAFQPFFRAHAHMDTPRREPWTQNEEHMGLIRDALKLRYTFLPYWYTLFARAEFDGQPPFAPLLLHFPEDERVFTIDNQHMVGEALLVHPVVDEGALHVEPYLPNGVWYLFPDWKTYAGGKTVSISVDLSSIPLFYRGGWIVPKKARERRSSVAMDRDPYTIIISLDPSIMNATGYLYYDDFHSVDVSKAKFYRMEYITLTSGNPSGFFSMIRLPRPGTDVLVSNGDDFIPKIERILLVGFNVRPQRVSVTERASGVRRRVDFFYSPPDSPGLEATHPGLLVIRQPDVDVSDTWSLHVSTSLDTDDEL